MADVGILTSLSPADQESLQSSIEKWARDKAFMTDGSLPAMVESYDRVKNVATVRPVIARMTVSGVQINRKAVYDVPVVALGAGGFVINFPVKPGDIGWINACDRDLDTFKQQLDSGVSDAPPVTARVRTFADSWFVPDIMRRFTVLGAHSDEAVFQSLDGSSRVAVGSGKVTVGVSGSTMVVTGGNVTITSASITFDGPISCTNTLNVAGAAAMNGGFTSAEGTACSLPSSATVNGKKVDTHTHGGVTPGGGSTAPF